MGITNKFIGMVLVLMGNVPVFEPIAFEDLVGTTSSTVEARSSKYRIRISLGAGYRMIF